MSDVVRVASRLRGARAVVVMTGGGISAESGVPTFRGADGLWRSFRPEDLATPQAFARDPELVWNWDSRFPDYLLLTQNVDGLHTRVGLEAGGGGAPPALKDALPTCSSCRAIEAAL